MRILFLSDARTYHTHRWVNYFADRGHSCFLVTLDRGFETKAEEFFFPSKILPNYLKYPLAALRIKGLLGKIKPDLVNAHFVPSYGLTGALLKFHPLVVSTWGSDVLISPTKSWLHKKRARYVLGKADLVTADAQVSAQAIYRLGVEKNRVAVSPMGIEKALLGQSQKGEKKQVLVLSNRKLEPLYDVVTLIKAIPLVIRQIQREIRFIILGEGSQKNRLLNLAIKLKVETHLEFRGIVSREQLLNTYRDSDIFVSPSLSDSSSVSLLEAMSFGLIPLVTDIPGNREWIQDDKNGYLFPKSNPEILAQKMVYAIDHSDRWSDFRRENHGIIESRAIWEDNMKSIENRFKQLVSAFS
jgi:glycosyltransferase involved in cell wall biosynthesis